MKKRELIISTKDLELVYEAPFLVCGPLPEGTQKIHAGSIRAIQILVPCNLHSSVMEMVYKYGVQISIHHERAYPVSRILPSSPLIDRSLYKTQIANAESIDMLEIACAWLDKKQTGRVQVLYDWIAPERTSQVQQFADRWSPVVEKAVLEKVQERVEEAHASKEYWKLFNLCLPHRFRFHTRSKHPAEDLTNALLNYTYGILYHLVESQLIRKGLDPGCGIFHADGHGRKSLVYDLVEVFRPRAESFVIGFIKKEESRMAELPFQTRELNAELKRTFSQSWKEYNIHHNLMKEIAGEVKLFCEYLQRKTA